MSFTATFSTNQRNRRKLSSTGSVRSVIELPKVQGVNFAGLARRQLTGLVLLSLGFLLASYLFYQRFIWQLSPNRNQIQPGQVLAAQGSQPVSFGDLVGSAWTGIFSDPGLRLNSVNWDGKQRIDYPAELVDFKISLPRLSLEDRQVQVGVDGTNKKVYLPVLKNSLAHFAGTALPGQEGNSFIFGHSMLPILARSSYESIFTYLPKMTPGDVIWVEIAGQKLKYEVFETQIVEPTDVSILAQPQGQHFLTLMTCVPPGFGQKRLLVKAQMVSAL